MVSLIISITWLSCSIAALSLRSKGQGFSTHQAADTRMPLSPNSPNSYRPMVVMLLS